MTEPVILLAGGDLMARARIEGAVARLGGRLTTTPVGGLQTALEGEPPSGVILDLDAGGGALLGEVQTARRAGALPGLLVGYYSHVDDGLRRQALDAGCTPLPRGRLWRELDEVLSGALGVRDA